MRLSPNDRHRQTQLETASAKLDEVKSACGMLVIRLHQLWRHNPQISPLELNGIEQELACIVDRCLDGHELIKQMLLEDRGQRRGKSE